MRRFLPILFAALLPLACSGEGGNTDSESHWQAPLGPCQIDDDCADGLSCECGVCTEDCAGAGACAEHGEGVACVARNDLPASCSGRDGERSGVCLLSCASSAECGEGRKCEAGSCVGVVEAPGGTDGDLRLAALSDAQIDAICADVTRQVDLDCGQVDSNGDPILIRETPGQRDCVAALERLRDSRDSGCLLAADVTRCWSADACDRYTTDVCDMTCPEYEACWTYAVEECEAAGEGFCGVATGQRWREAETCLEPASGAYCAPSPRGCDSAFTAAVDADGQCWWFSGICGLPAGWRHVDGAEGPCPADLHDSPTCTNP